MQKGVDRRERIMRAAGTHFLKDGFERTSMDRIAASARVSKQAIYEHFRDKEDLFDQVVRLDLAPASVRDLSDRGDLFSTAVAAAETLFEAFVQPRNFGLFRANIVATRRFPQLAADLHDFRRSHSRTLGLYLEQQAQAGMIAPIEGNPVDLGTRLGGMSVEGARYFLGYKPPAQAVRQLQARLAAEVYCFGAGKAVVPAGLDPQPAYAPISPEPPATVQMRMSAERFAALCDAAADEFLAHGFEGASLDAIAAATGVGRATIYRRFGGKAGLFAYVIEREIAAQWQDIAMPEGDTPLLRMERLCRIVLDLHLAPRSLALYYLLVQESDQFPDLARRFYDMKIDRVARPLQRIVASAGMAPMAPALLRMFHTLAVFGVRYVVSLRAVDDAERALVSRQAAAIFWQGISGPRT